MCSMGEQGVGGMGCPDQVAGEGLLAPWAVDGVADGSESGYGAVCPRVLEGDRQCAMPCVVRAISDG